MPRLPHDSIFQQGFAVPVDVDGETFEAVAGDSVAAALVASGKLALKRDNSGAPRGLFCGMGTCFDCQVSVDSRPAQRACLTEVRPGMKIRSLAYRAGIPQSGAASQEDQPERLECDALIVGAGPAGMSTAVQLAESGVSVIVADERPESGGQFFKQIASSYSFANDSRLDSQYRDGTFLIERMMRTDARVISDATVWGAFQ